MKTHVVQLERDDDVVSARDKMMWSKAPRILLVWPRRGKVLDRELDLVLMRRQSQNLGAQLAVVTLDEDVLTHARSLSIPAFVSISEAQREVWKTSRRSTQAPLMPPGRRTLKELQNWKQSIHSPASQKPAIRVGAFMMGVLAVLILGMFLLPGASISFKVKQEVQRVNLTLLARADASVPNVRGVVPARTVTVIVEGQDQISAEGALKLSDKRAEGEVVLTNLTDEEVEVESGTILLTLDDPPVRFQTLRKMIVPAGTGESVATAVEAVMPGASGNVAGETIVAVEGGVGLSVSVDNPAAMQGGEDRTVPMPTDLDALRLRERVLSSLQESARIDMERMMGDSKLLMVDTISLQKVISEQQEPPPGEPGDMLSLSIQAEYAAQYIERADIETVAQLALDASLPKGYSVSPGTLDLVQVRQISAGREDNQWQIVAEQQIYPQWRPEVLARSLVGARPAEVVTILSRTVDLDGPPQVQLSPSWWPRLPYLPLRIQLEEQ